MSWLTDYLDYTRKQESPEVFHMWSGIAYIAAALGRNVWLNRRSGGVTRYQIFPGQLMIVLTADSGRVRKTTALMQGKGFLKSINKPIISGKSSPEAFLKQLDPGQGGKPQAMLMEGELTVFLTKATYAEPLIDVLIKLADAEDELHYNTIGHGHIVIPKPCLTLLAATTPESLGDRLPQGAHGSGFMSRVVFIYARNTDRFDALADVEDTDTPVEEVKRMFELEKHMHIELKRLASMAGPFVFTPSGKDWFMQFYRRWVDSPAGAGEGWPARRPDHTLRVAMIIAASKNARLELDDKSLIAADHLITLAEADFDKALAYVGTSYAKDRQRIIDFITLKAGRATTTEVIAALYPYFQDTDILKRTLRLLSDAGVLKHNFTTTQPPVEYWSLAGFTLKL